MFVVCHPLFSPAPRTSESFLLCLSFEPIFCVSRPGSVGITAMQQIVRCFGPATGFLVGATIARRSHGEVQRFRCTGISRIFLCPFDRDATEIVRSGAQSLKGGELFVTQSLRRS